jgi:4-alpha-glucanotransferase
MSNNQLHDLFNTTSREKWKRIGIHRRAGVLAPLFFVYSKNTAGVGDFDDLKLMVDWCEKTGNSILQLLPMNEGGTVFCPYDSMSSFAIEPAYISLEAFPQAKKRPVREMIANIRKSYPAGTGFVNYNVRKEKDKVLWEIYSEDDGVKARDFKKFIDENEYWLEDFALYKTLRNYHDGKPWYKWEDRYKGRDYLEIKKFRQERDREITYHMWVQWQAYKQFKAAKAYAATKDIFLKGDLPILVSRDSADVWAHTEFFKLEFAAGAPPDMYCAKGQRWGMPTYNWEAKSADGYRYLKAKLKYAENFYDILRVDHVVGLFRIWSIPTNDPTENEGLHGNYDPWDQGLWERNGRERLSVILDNTSMLLCAEDLGMIPEACPRVLREYGIPGNEVQRWVKDWSSRHDFLRPEEYRPTSVAMLATHDTTNWAAWWENEAGTVDEELFRRKCAERWIDYNSIKPRLFNLDRSAHGRLRWNDGIHSSDQMAEIMGKPKHELMDFADMYENTYREKEKLWNVLSLKGHMREKCDPEIIKAALKLTYDARSIFTIQLIVDLLSVGGVFKGDPYQYRMNTPGTVSDKNWSLTSPISMEEMLTHRSIKEIKAIIQSSGR